MVNSVVGPVADSNVSYITHCRMEVSYCLSSVVDGSSVNVFFTIQFLRAYLSRSDIATCMAWSACYGFCVFIFRFLAK